MSPSPSTKESDAANVAEFVAKTKVPQPAYIKRFQNDEKFISMVDARWSGGLPFTVVYDRTGKKVRVFPGEVDIRELEQVIQKLNARPLSAALRRGPGPRTSLAAGRLRQ